VGRAIPWAKSFLGARTRLRSRWRRAFAQFHRDGKISGGTKAPNLVRDAHAAKLAVHPYTLRADELPKFAASTDDALAFLFGEARIDGLFTDFPDTAVQSVRAHPAR
jgi:glycerophosphoryl diester phosphodiesterase